MDDQNRRDTKRLSRRISLRFGPEEPRESGFIKNMSLQGLSMSSRVVFPVHTSLNFDIQASGGTIQAKGVVQWKRDPPRRLSSDLAGGNGDMGIYLTERPKEYTDLFHDLLEDFREGRREQRFDKVFKVTFENPEEIIEEYTRNISLGGMFIDTDDPPPLHTRVELKLLIGDIMKLIHIETKVVHVVDEELSKNIGMGPGVGLQIVQFFGDGEKTLKDYVESLKAREGV